MRPCEVRVPSISENSARIGPRSSEIGKAIPAAYHGGNGDASGLRDELDVADRLETRAKRATERPVTLTREPVLEIDEVEAHDAADLEHRQAVGRPTRHVAAPAFR